MVAVGTDFAKSNAKNWFGQTNFERKFCQNWPPMGLILARGPILLPNLVQSATVSYVANSAMQYSLLVFEIVFTTTVISWVSLTRGGWVVGVGVGGQAKVGPFLLLGHTQWCCVPSRQQECTQTTR